MGCRLRSRSATSGGQAGTSQSRAGVSWNQPLMGPFRITLTATAHKERARTAAGGWGVGGVVVVFEPPTICLFDQRLGDDAILSPVQLNWPHHFVFLQLLGEKKRERRNKGLAEASRQATMNTEKKRKKPQSLGNAFGALNRR